MRQLILLKGAHTTRGLRSSSNPQLAGSLYDIPVSGTHAHSWVMSFDTEFEAFSAFAEAMPGNCVFLVDTYNSLAGVRNAILATEALRARGGALLGIRLDSGDLGYLSIEARKILDSAGLSNASIVALDLLSLALISMMPKP